MNGFNKCVIKYVNVSGDLPIMAKIIAFSNQKGGVGKTTTCVNLAAYLALSGKKVLVIDIDPQGNTTTGMGVSKADLEHSTYDLIRGEYENVSDLILTTSTKNLFLMPTNIDLAGAEVELVKMMDRDHVVEKALKPIINDYDYIFMDCPPSLGMLTLNALTAANSVMIPIQSEFYALEGLTQLMNTIRLVIKHLNSGLKLEGVVLTMYDPRSLMSKQVSEQIRKHFADKLFKTAIPRNVRLSEAPSHGVPVYLHDPRCAGARAYSELAREFLTRQ